MVKKAYVSIKIFTSAVAVLAVLCCSACLGSLSSRTGSSVLPVDYPFTVSVIDVGQGDCALIRCEETNVLVDSGDTQYSDVVLGYLEKLNIGRLDCYVLSHPHIDHIGAAADILDNVAVGTVIMTEFSEINMPTTRAYENLLDALEESAAVVEYVKAGDSFTFGKLDMKILAPFEETDDYNDMSVVFKASYMDCAALFTGDASMRIERQILDAGEDVSADILKVGHHGSSSASSEEFVRAVNPEVGVISCGKNNSYGHPHKETLDTFGRLGIKLFRTDKDGSVLFYSDGRQFFF